MALHASLQQLARVWAPATGRDAAALVETLLPWMLQIELEKIFRIVLRTHDTGAYGAFVGAIAAKHFPEVNRLAQLVMRQRSG